MKQKSTVKPAVKINKEKSTKVSAKQKILNFLSNKEGPNVLSVKDAQKLFKIKNVAARIAELRQEGHCIYTNTKKMKDGKKVSVYRIGKPSKAMIRTAFAVGGFSL